MNKKKISIIIPFYNGEVFISSLLDSLKESIILSTNSIEFEIIIVIDSMETHQSVIDLLFIKIFSDISIELLVIKNKKNLGVAGSRNEALKQANGNYYHIIDQDDQVKKTFYPKIVSLLDTYNFVLVNGEIRYTSKKFNTHNLYYFKPSINIIGLFKDDYIRSPGQIVFAKELLCNELLFPEPKKFKGADDRFFWINLFLKNKNLIKPIYVAEPYYIANIHEDNYSSDAVNLRRSALENWQIIQSHLNFSDFDKLINNDQIRLKYLLGDHLNFLNTIKGSYLTLWYFIMPNKILRFLVKRI